MKVIIFKAGSFHVGVSLSDVREVIRRESAAGVESVESIRGKFVKICDASAYLAGASSTEAVKKTILLESNGNLIGLSTSEVSRIYDVDEQSVQHKPTMSGGSSPLFSKSMFSLDGYSSPIFLLDLGQLFESQRGETSEEATEESKEQGEANSPVSRAICFKLGSCEYAFSIDETVEIIRGREARPIPDTKAVVEGVINLRGIVLPVIDLRKVSRVHKPLAAGGKDSSKIIVVKNEDQLIGFRVEFMTEVTQFLGNQLEPIPENFSSMGMGWINSMLKVNDDRTVFFIRSDWFVKHAA